MCLVCLLLCKEEGSSPVPFQLLRVGIWACMRCPCLMSLLGLGMGTMLANFYMCGILFNMLGRNASPREPMCFGCLMFSLSGPCEL